MSIACSHLPTPRGCSLVVSFLTSMLITVAAPAHAQKTISYYSENVMERIDKVLACRDGAEDPMSLACRNASTAQLKDVQLASRFQTALALKKWEAKNEPNKRESRTLLAIDRAFDSSVASSCIDLKSGSVPDNPTSKSSLKVALDEKLLEPLPAQPGKFRGTAKGEEFLRAQGSTSKTGYFCPVTVQYKPELKILDFKDMTAQYKGKKSEIGNVIKTLALVTLEVPLMNTNASVWYAKKLYPKVVPLEGTVLGRYFVIDFSNKTGTSGFGTIVSIDGATFSANKPEDLLDALYK